MHERKGKSNHQGCFEIHLGVAWLGLLNNSEGEYEQKSNIIK